MRESIRVVVVSLLVLVAAPAEAGPELALTLGVRGGGEVTLEGPSSLSSEPSFELGPTLGLVLSWELRPEGFIEAIWSHQKSEFDVVEVFPGEEPFGMGIGQLIVAGMYRPERDGTTGFVLAGAGLTYLDPEPSGFDTGFGFSMLVGGGGMIPLSERWSLRLEGRLYLLFANTSISGVCGGVGCQIEFSGNGALQFEADIGVAYRF